VAYWLAGAVAGQVAGVLFGTVGAGNSIAVCGLAGGVLGAYARRLSAGTVDRLPAAVCAGYALVMVSTAFSGTVAGIVVAVAAGLAIQLVRLRERVPAWLLPALGLAAAGFLAGSANLHGVALLGGGLVGLVCAPEAHGRAGY
jgi:hypothetical protein